MPANNPAYGLGQSLGQLVLGNPDASNKAYMQGQLLGSQVSDRMASAARNRAAAMIDTDRLDARGGITPQTVQAAGYSPEQATLLGSILRAATNPDLRSLGVLQNPTAGADLADASAAMRSGDVGLGNHLLIAAGGKPVKTTDINQGQAFDPYGASGQAVNVTPLGDALIGRDKAAATASYGQANAANAHARLFDTQTAAGGFNPHTGAGAAIAGIPPPVADPNQPHGDTFLQSLPSNVGAQVKALAEGRMQFPAGYALKAPYWQQMLSAVAQYDPSFDAVNYNARASTRRDFTSGKSAQQINALNTAIGHMQSLSDSADALGNTGIPAINQIGNWLSTQSGNPKVNNFDTTRKAVVDELTRVWRGTGGSEKDIETWTKSLNDAGSPAQLHGAIAQIGELLQSKINSLANTYKQGMGTTSQPTDFVTPKAAQTLDILERRAGVTPPADVMASAAGVGVPLGNAVSNTAPHGSGLGEQAAAVSSPALHVPAAMAPRAVDPKTGHAVTWNGSAWVPEQ